MEEKNIVQRKLTIENIEDLELTLDCINLHCCYTLVLNNGKFIFTTMSMDDARRDTISTLLDTFGIKHTFEDIPWENESKEEIDISEEDTEDEETDSTVVDEEDA